MPKSVSKTREQRILESLGLGENEALLYTFMLKHPRSTVQELQRRTPIPRTMLYYVLGNLTQAGLVSVAKASWPTVYVAEDPERLYDILSERRRLHEQQENDIRESIPLLRQTYRLASSRPGVRMFEGLDQYQIALNELFTPDAKYIYSYAPNSAKDLPGVEMRKAFHEARRKKGAGLRVLAPSSAAQRIARTIGRDPLAEIRIFAAGEADLQMSAGKLLYTRYEKREPLVMLIEDAPLYKMQAALFETIWRNASPYSPIR